jgi:hypothetical protein
LPAAVLRSVSLRSSSLRSAAGKTVGEAEDIPLFFTLIPVLALLSNYDRENCLINVGTEGCETRAYRHINSAVRCSLRAGRRGGGAKSVETRPSSVDGGLGGSCGCDDGRDGLRCADFVFGNGGSNSRGVGGRAPAKTVVRLREELLVLCQEYAAKSVRSN